MEFVKLGAIGYQASKERDHMGRTQIIQIIASYGPERLNYLQFHYLENGSVHASSVIGSPRFVTGSIFNTFTFEGLHEHITKVEGVYNKDFDLTSKGFVNLRIRTSVKEHVICDIKVKSDELQTFSFNFGGLNQFGGFHGSESDKTLSVSSIGVYFKQLVVPPPSFLPLRDPHQAEAEAECSTELLLSDLRIGY